ncbi:MAG: CvpA family protein [Thermodesulfobacteriota bacterium]
MLFILALAYCPLAGWLAGPFREGTALVGLLLGFLLACFFHPEAAGMLGRWFSDPDYLSLLGFLAIWMAVGFVTALGGLVADRILKPRKGFKRRGLAAGIGLIRAVCFAAALLIPLVTFFSENAAVLRRSRFAPAVMGLSDPLVGIGPEPLREAFRSKARTLRRGWAENQA